MKILETFKKEIKSLKEIKKKKKNINWNKSINLF